MPTYEAQAQTLIRQNTTIQQFLKSEEYIDGTIKNK